jgi:hypothetical protein
MPRSPQQIAEYETKLDRFAELLSLDLDTAQIAQRMGIQRTLASQYLGILRKKYGWQAQ